MKKNMRFVGIFLLVFIIAVASIEAREDKKENALNGFEDFVHSAMKEWKVPGLALSIVRDGKVLYSKGFGYRDVENRLKVTPETLFAIGSCTKAFTSVTVGLLVDEGRTDWDTPVRNFLPTFKLKDSFASERMTPRDLLCHRSGLPRHDFVWYNATANRKELFERLQYLEPNADFRTAYQYQNLMFMTAGYLVEQTAGIPWEEFVRDRIFGPLGMKDSNFSVEDSQKVQDYALPYLERDDEVIEIPFRNIDTIGPAGSINSNVTDMAQWILLNLNKGKFGDQQIVSEASLREIHSPQMIATKVMQFDESFYNLYGMGWLITSYRGHLLLVHQGGIDGFTALVSLMPRDNMGLVILTNLNGNPIPPIVMYRAYDRLLGLEPIPWGKRVKEIMERAKNEAEKAKKEQDEDRKLNTTPSHPLEDYVGDYENPGYGILSIQKEGNSLVAVFNSISYTGTHYHYDVFEFQNEQMDESRKVSFFTDVKGNINKLSVPLEPMVDPIVFTRAPDKKMKK